MPIPAGCVIVSIPNQKTTISVWVVRFLHVAKVTCRGTASQPHGQVPELTKRAKHAPKFDHASNFASDFGEVADDGSQVVRRLCNLILLCSSQACESKLDDVAQRIDGFKEAMQTLPCS